MTIPQVILINYVYSRIYEAIVRISAFTMYWKAHNNIIIEMTCLGAKIQKLSQIPTSLKHCSPAHDGTVYSILYHGTYLSITHVL